MSKNLLFWVASVVGVTVAAYSGSASAGPVSHNNLRLRHLSEFPNKGNVIRKAEHVQSDRPSGESELLVKSSWGYEAYLGEYAIDKVSNGSVVEMIEEGDGETVWFNNPTIGLITSNWYKGTKEGDRIVVRGPQAIVEDPEYGEMLYLMPCEYFEDEFWSWYRPTADREFIYNVHDGKIESSNPDIVLGLCFKTGDDEYEWAAYGDYDIVMAPHTAVSLQLPENVDVEEWTLSDGQMGHTVKVGVDGDVMYVGGILPSLPDAYIKGLISGEQVTFDSNQYLGIDGSYLCDAYFIGSVDNSFYNEYGEYVVLFDMLDSISFGYDAAGGVLSNDSEAILVNAGTEYTNKVFSANHPTIKKLTREPGTAPMAPEFTDVMWYESDFGFGVFAYMVPNIDVNGFPLNTNQLYYKVYYNDEEVEFYPDECPGLTEPTILIPYDFYDNVGIYGDDTGLRTIIYYSQGVDSISLQSVYVEEDGSEVYSEISTIANESVKVGEVAAGNPVRTVFYDLQGNMISAHSTGIVIEKQIFSDGSCKVRKIMR